MKKIVFIIIISINFIFGQTKNSEWKEDIEFIAKELPKKHVSLFENITEEDFNLEIKNLIDSIENFSEDDIQWKITSLLSKIKDSHSGLKINTKQYFPYRINWFSDGYYITEINQENSSYLGSKIISINSIPIKIIEEKIAKVIYCDNIASIRKNVSSFLKNASLLLFLKINSANTLKIETTNNKIISTFEIAFDDKNNKLVALNSTKTPFYQSKGSQWFWYDYQEKENTLYIRYKNCNSREHLTKHKDFFKVTDEILEKTPYFKPFSDSIISILNNKKINKIVFDFRGNTGGSSVQGTELIKEVKNTLAIKNNAKVFTLIDRYVFSSAIINSLDTALYLNTTFVGESTSGSPNHFGELKNFELPKSKLSLSYSTKYFKSSISKYTNTIEPDIKIELTIEDYKNGNDKIEAFLKSNQ